MNETTAYVMHRISNSSYSPAFKYQDKGKCSYLLNDFVSVFLSLCLQYL